MIQWTNICSMYIQTNIICFSTFPFTLILKYSQNSQSPQDQGFGVNTSFSKVLNFLLCSSEKVKRIYVLIYDSDHCKF